MLKVSMEGHVLQMCPELQKCCCIMSYKPCPAYHLGIGEVERTCEDEATPVSELGGKTERY